MFLDLPGYRHVARLEQELTSRGATLETQFHSGVKYLITMARNGDGKGHSNSPSTPSPLTPGRSSISQLLSPATDHSPSEATPVRHGILTRSQQMLQLSRGRGGRKADLQALAQQWGSKVVTLEELLGELKRLKPLPSAATADSSDTSTCGRESKVRALRGAFLKVEDLSRLYRPLVLEMKRWPRPLCHASHKASPFDPPHLTAKSPEQQQQLQQKKEMRGDKVEKRPGHCECCSVKFDDLQMHLRSSKHQEYASNEKNFASLDKLMAQSKPFDQFIAELRATPPEPTCATSLPTYTPPATSPPVPSSRPDSVVLVTPPTSRATPTRRRSPRKHPCTAQHHSPLKKNTPSPRKPNRTDSTPINRKRKASSCEATPTNKSPRFETTPTKQLRFSPELSIPLKRLRSHSHSTTPPSTGGSPARKRARPAVTPSPSPEGVRRSPRLLLRQMAAEATNEQ
ncbi:Protein DBF4 homolog B [Geodia barretti]|nr:Protein DBF4 homolog B [Geodia barretti]